MKRSDPDAPRGTDLLQRLCEQLETTWNERRDASIVDGLASEHPECAGALYEFFAVLVQSEIDLDQPDPTLAGSDARARAWLGAGGYALVAEVARQYATPPSTDAPHLPRTPDRHDRGDARGDVG